MRTINSAWILRRLATLTAVISLTLVLVAGLTGVLLAFYYDPSVSGAFESLRRINEEVPGGSLVRSLHNIAGNALIYTALLQIFVMFFGRQHQPAWFTGWLSGGFLALSAIGLGWTAMILDWDQIGYWRLKIEMGTLGNLPVLGPILKAVFLGGDGICTGELPKLAAGAMGDGQVVCAEAGGVEGEQKAGMEKFRADFKAKFNTDVQIYAPYVYDAVNVMVAAMEKAGSSEPAKYLPVLAATDGYKGVTGTISFDEKGDIKNGALTLFTYKAEKRDQIAVVR